VYHLLPLTHVQNEIRTKLSASERLPKHLKFLACPTHFMFQFTTVYQKVHSLKLNKIFTTTSVCLSISWNFIWNAASDSNAKDTI